MKRPRVGGGPGEPIFGSRGPQAWWAGQTRDSRGQFVALHSVRRGPPGPIPGVGRFVDATLANHAAGQSEEFGRSASRGCQILGMTKIEDVAVVSAKGARRW